MEPSTHCDRPLAAAPLVLPIVGGASVGFQVGGGSGAAVVGGPGKEGAEVSNIPRGRDGLLDWAMVGLMETSGVGDTVGKAVGETEGDTVGSPGVTVGLGVGLSVG